MKAADARKLIGKTVRYKSDKSRAYVKCEWVGVIEEVVRTEVYINGDWERLKGVEVLEVLHT